MGENWIVSETVPTRMSAKIDGMDFFGSSEHNISVLETTTLGHLTATTLDRNSNFIQCSTSYCPAKFISPREFSASTFAPDQWNHTCSMYSHLCDPGDWIGYSDLVCIPSTCPYLNPLIKGIHKQSIPNSSTKWMVWRCSLTQSPFTGHKDCLF